MKILDHADSYPSFSGKLGALEREKFNSFCSMVWGPYAIFEYVFRNIGKELKIFVGKLVILMATPISVKSFKLVVSINSKNINHVNLDIKKSSI